MPLSEFSEQSHTRILKHRETVREFMRGTEKHTEFAIDCSIEERIRFIYAIIFPGREKWRFYGRFFLARIAASIDYSPLKVLLYRAIGMKIGQGVFISPGVVLDPHFPALIEIGDHAIIGWGTILFTHEFSGSRYRVGRIKIGRGAVIGGLSVVRGGVCIGDDAEVASTAIVYKDVPNNYCMDSVILLNRALIDTYRNNAS